MAACRLINSETRVVVSKRGGAWILARSSAALRDLRRLRERVRRTDLD